MSPKKKKQEISKLYCLCQLLVESLDTLEVTTEKMLKFKTDLIGLCEALNDDVANSPTILKSTYFNEITNKIDSVIRNNFKDV